MCRLSTVYCKEYKFRITSQEKDSVRGKDSRGNKLVLDIEREGKLFITLSIKKNGVEKVIKGASKTGIKRHKSIRVPGNYVVYRFYRMQGAYIEVYSKRVVVKM